MRLVQRTRVAKVNVMLILGLLIILAPLGWMAYKRMQQADPAAGRRLSRLALVCIGAALAVRVAMAAPGLLRVAILALGIGAFALWLLRRGHGGDGPDDGHDPPVDPGPDPSGERLDPEAFDRARDDWEHTLRRG
jgi:hypothetical protein